MRFEYDRDADAVYVSLFGDKRPIEQTKTLDSQRNIDYGRNGEPAGIEFLAVSRGVDLGDLPCREELANWFEGQHLPIFA